MQSNEMVEKKRSKWDGEEIKGLVGVGEIKREKRTVEVPGFNYIKDIQSGTMKLPQIMLEYKLERDSGTEEFLESFITNNEVKDLEIINTDAHGVEFSRRTYARCEVIAHTEPAYDALNPTYAKRSIMISIGDII